MPATTLFTTQQFSALIGFAGNCGDHRRSGPGPRSRLLLVEQ